MNEESNRKWQPILKHYVGLEANPKNVFILKLEVHKHCVQSVNKNDNLYEASHAL